MQEEPIPPADESLSPKDETVRPRMSLFEKIIISLVAFTFLITRLDIPGRSILSILISFLIIFGGYFLFKPSKEIKGGKIIAIINGILLGIFVWYELLYFFMVFLELREALILYGVGIVLLGALVITLFQLNKPYRDNHPYIKKIILWNAIPVILMVIPIVLPDYTRVIIFHGEESASYYTMEQDKYITETYTHIDKGEKLEAIRSALAAVNCSRIRMDANSYLYIAALNALGYSYYKSNNYYKADSVLTIALRRANMNDLDKGNQYRKTLRYLSFNCSDWGDWRRSDSLVYKLLAVEKNPEETIYLMGTLATNSGKRGDFNRADSIYIILLQKQVRLNVPDPVFYIITHSDWAGNCIEKNQFLKADSLYQTSLHLLEKYPGDNNEYRKADIYRRQSDLYYRLARYDDAKKCNLKAMKIVEKLMGEDSQAYLSFLAAHTYIRMALSDYTGVEQILKQLIEKAEQKYGNAIPLIGNASYMLSQLYCDYADYESARFYAKQSLNNSVSLYGRDSYESAFPLDKLAYAEYCLDNFSESDSLYRYCLAVKRFYKGMENQSYAVSMNGLGLVCSALNLTGKADTLFDYSKFIIGTYLGHGHPDYAMILNNIGNLRLNQKRIESADSCFTEALKINEKSFGLKHVRTADNLIGLARVKIKTKKSLEAKQNYLKALDIYKSIFPFEHPQVKNIEEEMKRTK